jgi:acetate kinase
MNERGGDTVHDAAPGEDTRLILALNGGSSSVKFSLITVALPQHAAFSGTIDDFGHSGARLRTQDHARGVTLEHAMAGGGDERAFEALAGCIERYCPASRIAAVGHRLVHGGPDLHRPQRVTPALLATLRRIAPLAPVHMPAALRLIESVSRRFPLLPQTVCFDTAFHSAMPRVATLLPIPFRYHDAGLRRYGFHGLSCEFLMDALAGCEPPARANGRVILAHLGRGVSLSAVHRGRPVETSMGFTPASGVPMGTRSGDIDPGLAGHLARTEGMDPERFERMMNFESGLLGVSGTSADMRALLAGAECDARAADAVALFCHRVRMQIGALAAALGGLDLLVFSGGIGEHAAPVRARICDGLQFLGIDLDPVRNASNAGRISADSASVTVRVMHTDEEMVIARATLGLLEADANAPQPHA